MANNVDPDGMAQYESHLALRCLQRYGLVSRVETVNSGFTNKKKELASSLQGIWCTVKQIMPRKLAKAVLTSIHNLCFEQKYENLQTFPSESFHFFGGKILNIFEMAYVRTRNGLSYEKKNFANLAF